MADDPTRGRNNPHNIPSQNPVRRNRLYLPEGRGRGADLAGGEILKRRHPNMPMPGEGVTIDENLYSENPVLSTYDSRPVNSSDFFVTSTFVFPANDQSVSIEFRVPEGRVLVVRKWSIDATFSLLEPFSDIRNVLVRFLVDESDVPNYSNLPFRIRPLGTSNPVGTIPVINLEEPTFIVAPADSIFTFRVDITANTTNIFFDDGELTLYGNLLRATGRNLNFEQATENPLPVVLKG